MKFIVDSKDILKMKSFSVKENTAKLLRDDLLTSKSINWFNSYKNFTFDIGKTSKGIIDWKHTNKLNKHLASQDVALDLNYDIKFNNELATAILETKYAEQEIKKVEKKFKIYDDEFQHYIHSILDCILIPIHKEEIPTIDEIYEVIYRKYDKYTEDSIYLLKEKILSRFTYNFLKAQLKNESNRIITFGDCIITPLKQQTYKYIDLKCTIKEALNSLRNILKINFLNLFNFFKNDKRLYRIAYVYC